MNKRLKSLPKFRSEVEKRQFWEIHDSSEYIEQGRAGALSKSKAIDDCNIATPAGGAP
jgi:hypothetical protein